MLGGFEFGVVGQKVDEPQAIEHPQSRLGVPAGSVEQQEDHGLRA